MAIEDRSLTDSLYFIIVTIATVGYGDVHPVTPLGKLFTVILIILGVGTFLGVIANVTEMMLSKREKRVRMENKVMGDVVYFYHFLFSISIFRRALAMAEVQTPT